MILNTPQTRKKSQSIVQKKWYNDNSTTRNSRINADGVERDIIWKYANEIKSKSNQTLVIAPVNYKNNKYIGAIIYNEKSTENDTQIKLENNILIEEKLLFCKDKKGNIKNYYIRFLPNKKYAYQTKNINNPKDFDGLILLYDSNNDFIEGSVFEKGKNVSLITKTIKNARMDCKSYTVVTGTTVYVSSCGTNCTDVTVVGTTSTQVFCYDPDVSGEWTGSNVYIDPRDAYINSTGYVNLVDCDITTSLQDWEDLDYPCTFNYGGETGLSKSELFMSILVDEALNQLGITEAIAAITALSGANLIETRTKFANSTPRTSIASKYLSRIIPGTSPVNLPTLTGWPGVGSGLRLSWTKSFGRFAGRTVPVIGWGILAYDLVSILYKTTSKFNEITQGC